MTLHGMDVMELLFGEYKCYKDPRVTVQKAVQTPAADKGKQPDNKSITRFMRYNVGK